MKMGMSLRDAGLETLRDLAALEGAAGYYMNIVALSPAGEHAGFTTIPGKRDLYMTAAMDEPARQSGCRCLWAKKCRNASRRLPSWWPPWWNVSRLWGSHGKKRGPSRRK